MSEAEEIEELNAGIEEIIALLTEIRDAVCGPRAETSSDAVAAAFAQPTAMPLPPKRGSGIFSMRGPLPDPMGTPGALNPDVTLDTLEATIGTPGWTATVRPPTGYTNPLKVQVMEEYGDRGDPADRELDHLVPLCCGGHPTSPLNLWPQPRATEPWNARVKDLTEVAAMHAILAGRMSLVDVQAGFMHDWTALHNRLFRDATVVRLMMAQPPPDEEP